MSSRRTRSPAATLGGVAVLDTVALLMLLASRSLAAGAVALTVHAGVTAAGWLLLRPGSRRELAIAWVATLPGVGALVALVGIDLRGEGDLRQFDRGQPPERPQNPLALAQLAASHVPTCEQLVSGDAEERRAALGALTERGDADAIEILRWSLRQNDGELALEAALALEELAARHEQNRIDSRRRLAEQPSFAHALAAGDVLLDAIRTRLVEPELVPNLAAEAREHYEKAARLDPAQAGLLVERRARIELYALRPAAALRLLEAVVHGPNASAELSALYHDATVAARRAPRDSAQGAV